MKGIVVRKRLQIHTGKYPELGGDTGNPERKLKRLDPDMSTCSPHLVTDGVNSLEIRDEPTRCRLRVLQPHVRDIEFVRCWTPDHRYVC